MVITAAAMIFHILSFEVSDADLILYTPPQSGHPIVL
jgi:hypothetical protein